MNEYSSETPHHISISYLVFGFLITIGLISGLVMMVKDYDYLSWIPIILSGVAIFVGYNFYIHVNRNIDSSKFYAGFKTCPHPRCDSGTITIHDHHGSYWQEDCSDCSGKGYTKYSCIVKTCELCKGSGGCWSGNNKVTCPCVLKNYESYTKKID